MQVVRKNTGSSAGAGALIDAMAAVSEGELRATVERIAVPRHRVSESNANRAVGTWIAAQWRDAGYEVRAHGSLGNVVATRARAEGERVVLVGAHFDSVPRSPGADDNASGVAAMLACARVMARYAPEVPVAFVAFNGEEDGLEGSAEFAPEATAVLGGEVACAHVLESIGYARHDEGSQRAPMKVPIATPTVGDFLGLLGNRGSNAMIDRVAKWAEAYVPELPVYGLKVHLGLEAWLPVLHRSDHSPLWNAGIPAVMWTDTAEFRNPHYHRRTDTADTLDYGFLRRVTQLVVASVLRHAG